jgi:cytoskeletal protein CcmA (bactofilin family)
MAQKVEITGSGRVWGDVTTSSFSTEEGAFLRGKITMEDEIDLGWGPEPESVEDVDESEASAQTTRPAGQS